MRKNTSSPKRNRVERWLEHWFIIIGHLSEPAQTVLIIGLLLLLGWLIAHPVILSDLIQVMLGLTSIRGTTCSNQ